MSDDFDPKHLCRDDDCDIEEVHLAHKRLRRRPIAVHHRPNKNRRPLWQQDDPAALADSVLKSVGEQPTMMQWIARDVRDDYGTVTDRTIYRHVRRLVQEAQLIKLDLGLAFAAYIRPKSRLLSDPQALRDYMLSNADCIPTSTKMSFRRESVA